MEHLGIKFEVKNMPELDLGFIPVLPWSHAFLNDARKPVGIAVESPNGQVSTYRTFIHGTPDRASADRFYSERFVKSALWAKGGSKVYISGDRGIYEYIKSAFSPGGTRAFDSSFMSGVYGQPFEVVLRSELPDQRLIPCPVDGYFDGCRIGLDAGGSNIKVSSIIDGELVYSGKIAWSPKTSSDPDYHYEAILSALRLAAAKMPRVDAIGVSSAGIFIDNRVMVSALFLKVPTDLFRRKVRDIYLRAAANFGDVPVCVCNDGDVSALAGAIGLGDENVLGLSMGTSEAAGYVDENGNITGWLNELAFVPVDFSPDATMDEWSGDRGCGVGYLSQDGIIKLAEKAGVSLPGGCSPVQKLRAIQSLVASGDEAAAAVYRSAGVYLGHALAQYHSMYGFRHAVLMGGASLGKGGGIIADYARRVLAGDYPWLADRLHLDLPDNEHRLAGQSAAAACLPKIKKGSPAAGEYREHRTYITNLKWNCCKEGESK